MTQHWALILILLTWKVILSQGKQRSWTWSWPVHQLTDEEIVDLLYTDPDRLRALSYDSYEGSYGVDVPQALDYRPPVAASVGGGHRRPKTYDGGALDFTRDPDETTGEVMKPQATSYMRIQQFSPQADSKKIVSYSHLIVH